MDEENSLKTSDTERARKKTAKKLTDCIMSVLKFWKVCFKKKNTPRPELLDTPDTKKSFKYPKS